MTKKERYEAQIAATEGVFDDLLGGITAAHDGAEVAAAHCVNVNLDMWSVSVPASPMRQRLALVKGRESARRLVAEEYARRSA